MSQRAVKEAPAKYSVAPESNAESLITQHMDLWTSAISRKNSTGRGSKQKYELYGIKKLRELILELAVRGKLVPQDLNDEPASELLKRIEEKKSQLIVNGSLKGQKKAVLYDADVKAHEIPPGWIAADFGDITFNRDSDRIPLSVSERSGRQGVYDYYGASGVIDRIDDFLFDKPLLLIGEDGANLINRSTPIAFIARGRYWVNNHAHVIDGISEDLLIYLSLYINSISLLPYITGMAQPKMNQAKMNSIQVLVPPEEEQRRIVAKVDELMALCDQLENQTEQSLDAHATLADTLLDALTRAQSAAELTENWQRLEANWDTLFPATLAGERAIDKLKQTILQLAVMGKLVPQDPNEEPASELLKRIAAEKEQLVKEKKIKKQKALRAVTEEEKPFELPKDWGWAFLGNLSSDIHYGYTASAQPENLGTRLLRITDIQNDKVNWSTVPGCDIEDSKADSYFLDNDDILIARTGGTIGKSYLVEKINVRAVFASYLIRVKRISAMYASYIKTYLGSSVYWSQLYDNASGTGQPNVNATALKELLVPIPPLEEQKRIVAKVDELMALCDQLKERLETAQQTQQKFTNAVVSTALAKN